MKQTNYLLLIAIALLFFTSCNQSHKVTPNDWPQYKNDNFRSGMSSIAIFDNTFGEKWVYKAPQTPAIAWYGPAKEDAYALSGPLPSMRDYDLAYSPVIVGNKLFYGSSADDAMHCLNSDTGEEEWLFTTDGQIRIAPTYYDGNIYFGSDDGYVYCLNALTGKLKWKFSPSNSKEKLLNNGRLISFWPVRTGVLIEDGKAYFGASLIPWKKSYLCAIDAKSGKVKGEGTYVRELENVTFEGSMASSGDRLIQPQGRISPVFINKHTGEPEGQLPGTGGCFVLVTPENHVIHPQTSRYKSIVETMPGEKKPEYMSFKGGKEMIVAGDTSYVLSDNAISAYNRKTKEVLWMNKSYSAHRLIMADTVLFAGATDTVYAVSVTTGKPLWKGSVEGTVYAMAVGDSALFASTGEGKIFCFAKGGKNQVAHSESAVDNSNSKLPTTDCSLPTANCLTLATEPYVNLINSNSVTVEFKTQKPEKCTVYWHSKGDFHNVEFSDDAATKNHKFTIPVRKDFIYRYKIVSNNKVTKEFEYDNFFNYSLYKVNVSSDWFPNKSTTDYVNDIIEKTGERKGLCLILGLTDEQLPVELAQKTDLDVIVLDKSKKKINKFRSKLLKEGVYGRRISAYRVDDLNNLPVQSNLVNLVVSTGNDINVDEVIRLTAPYGKAVYLTDNDKEELSKLFYKNTESSDFDWEADNKLISLGSKYAIVLTKKEPETNGDWTHQYGAPDNSSFGGESLWGSTESDEFEIQWMGRPGPRFQTDRTGRKPSPLAVNGKMFVQGNQRVVAVNAYNGAVLWSKDIAGMLRMNVNHDCSNWAADDKFIYIAVKNRVLMINQDDGVIINELEVPKKNINRYDWGYTATANGLVIVSESPKNSSYTDYYGGYGWYDAISGPATEKVMSVSLSAYNSGSSDLKWKYNSGSSKIINPTIIIYDDKMFFVESATATPLSKDVRGGEKIFKKTYLVSLNVKDGSLNWKKRIVNEPGVTAYYMAAGAGRIVTESSAKGKYFIYNYSAADGSLQWETVQRWPSNNHGGHLSIPAIAGNRLMVKPALYNMETGERLNYDVPKAGHGCASYALTEQSVFYRGGSITQFNFDTKKFSKWERLRPDCWLSTVPALGMVLSPEGGGGCSCGNWFETSMVMAPKSRAPLMFKFDGDSRYVDSLTISLILKKGVKGELYYTTDGSVPDKSSARYGKPVVVKENTDFRVAMYYQKDGRERRILKSRYLERLRPAPNVEPEKLLTGGVRKIELKRVGKTGVVHFTVDGSVPDEDSPVYNDKIEISKKSTIKAVTVWNDENGKQFISKVTTSTIDVPELIPAVEKSVQPGLVVGYYEGSWKMIPDFNTLKAVKEEVVTTFSVVPAKRQNDYALRFTGFIRIPEDGIYTFYTRSDDGSNLYIDDKKVVDNDGTHAAREKSGIIPLQAGLHSIRVEYFQGTEGQSLGVVWEMPTSRKRRIPEDILFY